MKIGIFDSGIGGLSVLHLAAKLLPHEQFIYYADEAHVPYGEKTQKEIIGYVDDIVQFMLAHGVSAIVIACNTATSAAIELMRRKYSIPIVGMEPAVKKAVDACSGEDPETERILIAATPVTVRGQKMIKLVERVDPHHRVDLLALPGLVQFAERGEFRSDAVSGYLRDQLCNFRLEHYSAFVLGCTHFNYFKDTLREILPTRVQLMDGNEGTVNRLKHLIAAGVSSESAAPSTARPIEYYYSGEHVVQPMEISRLENYLARLDSMLFIR